jgi:hypothetical protein
VSDEKNRVLVASDLLQKQLNSTYHVQKALTARKGLIYEIEFRVVQLSGGATGPATVIAFAQPLIGDARNIEVAKCNLGRSDRP